MTAFIPDSYKFRSFTNQIYISLSRQSGFCRNLAVSTKMADMMLTFFGDRIYRINMIWFE